MLNFSLKDDVGMRIRVYSREEDPEMKNLAEDLIEIVQGETVFDTKAVFKKTTKLLFSDMYVKLKRHVLVDDLKFTYAEHKEGARVEARLARTDIRPSEKAKKLWEVMPKMICEEPAIEEDLDQILSKLKLQ
jgi:hypothetical protein